MTELFACFPKRLSWSAVPADVITPACSDYKYLYSAELHNNGCWIIVSTHRQRSRHICHRKYRKLQSKITFWRLKKEFTVFLENKLILTAVRIVKNVGFILLSTSINMTFKR